MDANTTYWTGYTVLTRDFKTRQESLDFVQWRNGLNLFREELMPITGHDGKVVLDYGCGTGNQIVNLLEFSKPSRLVGVDISPTALRLSKERASLHSGGDTVEFHAVANGSPRLLFDDNTFDLILCDGVLHHTPNPEEILAEFRRILKPGGTVYIYVYHYNSIWLHYYVAYEKRIKEGLYRDVPVREAFRHFTDGDECPISNCYTVDEFLSLCRSSGLPEAKFVGAGVLLNEMNWVQRRFDAIASLDLEDEHRTFLRHLTFDQFGRPFSGNVAAGSAGFFSFTKP